MECTPSSRTCDALIVGGGPAGSTAGHLLARAGHDVIVVERERFPRFHIGESLLPANIPLLEKLGVLPAIERAGSIPKHGATICAAEDDRAVAVRFSEGLLPCPPQAFQVVRSTFDDILLRACADAGARVLQGHRATRPLRTPQGWQVGVQGDEGESCEIHARHLIDASGRDTFLARARRSKEMQTAHRRVAIYAHFQGQPRASGDTAGNIILAVRRDGWLWAIPLTDGKLSLGLVVLADRLREHRVSAQEAFETAVENTPAFRNRVDIGQRISPIHATSNYSYSCGKAANEGALAIGDALAFLDPVFSTGVWLAMQGGESAATVIDACLSQPGSQTPALLDAWARRQARSTAYYWDLIESFYRPEFLDLFLQPPQSRIGHSLVTAMNSIFAGMGPGPKRLRLRLKIFTVLQRMQQRFGIKPRLALGSVFGS